MNINRSSTYLILVLGTETRSYREQMTPKISWKWIWCLQDLDIFPVLCAILGTNNSFLICKSLIVSKLNNQTDTSFHSMNKNTIN